MFLNALALPGSIGKHVMHSFRMLLVAVSCVLLLTQLTFAQGTRGTISGEVTDPNGAAVVGATVRLFRAGQDQRDPSSQTVEDGREVRSVQTNESGVYQFLEIEPGVYNVIITAPGFAQVSLRNANLEPNRNIRLDSTLAIGVATEEVTVTASQETIDRETPMLGTTVEARRVQGLPLNGRNILDLALLQPGVTTNNVGAIRGNGQRSVENNFQLDGSNNNETATGGSTGVQPRPDAVQEFRLLTSNFEAEFGRNTGTVINVVTRSGTNDFHGNVRAFWRPTFLSAARFFDQNDPSDAPLRKVGNCPADPALRSRDNCDYRRPFERKEFGGNFGGPIFLPRFGEGGPSLYNGKNRAFFFVDYEGRRQLLGSSIQLNGLPTPEEAQGIFTRSAADPLLDPATGGPFPIISSSGGNIRQQIPASRFSPIGQYYLGFIPTSASGTATVSAPEIENFDILTIRLDPWVSDKQQYGVTFNRFQRQTESPFPFFPTVNGANVPGFGSLDLRTTYNAAVRHTYTLSPTLINSFLVGFARNLQPSFAPQNSTTPQEIGFSANFVANQGFAGPPFIFLDDRGLRLGNTFQGPQARAATNFQIQDSVSWVKGDHRFKFGFDGTKYMQDQTFVFINQAIIGFGSNEDANTTGDDLADLLIGNSPGYIQFGSNGERDYRQLAGALFAQDNWRLSDELTLSLGMRYEYVGPLTDKANRVAYYRPTAAARGQVSTILTGGQLFNRAQQVVVPAGQRAPLGLLYVGDPDPDLGGTVPAGGVNRDLNNFAPRFGFAYAPKIEGGWLQPLFGNQQGVIRGGFGVFYGAIIGDTALQQLTAPGFQSSEAYFEEVGGPLANPFGPDPFPNFGNNVSGAGTDLTQPTIPNPFLAGVPTVGVSLSTRNLDSNTLRIANTARAIDPFIRTPYTYQYNLTFERSFLDNYVMSMSYVGNRGLKLYAIEQVNPSFGTFIPYPSSIPVGQQFVPSSSGVNTNARRVNPDFGVNIAMQVAAGNSWYNSFQANIQRRYSDGLLFQAAYTFSKSITDTAGTDTNRGGLDLIDRRFGRGLSSDDVPHRFVGSWIYDVPFDRWLGFSGGAFNRILGGWSLGGIYTLESGRPITVSNVSNTTGTSGVLLLPDLGAPFVNLDPRQNNGRAFNADAFKNATVTNLATGFRRGTAGVNQFRAKNGVNNFDLILAKNTRLWSESTNLELRFEAFNVLNHTQFTTIDTSLTSAGFGTFTAARESRVIQLGARFSF
jgi:hypothetical protein